MLSLSRRREHLDRAIARGRRLAGRAARVLATLFVAGAALLLPAGVRAEGNVHVVRIGDSLASIAHQYGVSLSDLSAHNGIADPNHIVIGQMLTIPRQTNDAYAVPAVASSLPGASGYHAVARGESLSQIAAIYGMAQVDLMRLNSLTDPNFVWVGQRLRLTARVDAQPGAGESKPKLADTIHVVEPGDSLASLARTYNTTLEAIMSANGLPNPNFVWVGQRLRIHANTPVASGFGVAGAPADGRRWIEVDLSDQTLTAWQGDVPVLHSVVSTGKWSTPTVTGQFQVGLKLDSQHMTGDDYDLPGVPWVMYFYNDYAIHGAYWHANFGTPTSHGCINMRIEDAEKLYAWAAAGTEVWVHE